MNFDDASSFVQLRCNMPSSGAGTCRSDWGVHVCMVLLRLTGVE